MTARRVCSVDGCGRPVHAAAICGKHYQRSRRGQPMDGELSRGRPIPLTAKFWSKVNKTETCWLWTAAVDRGGYGRIQHGPRSLKAHRLSYELHKGPIPDGYEIDHLCRVRNCVNPAHLEAVTKHENIRRSPWGQKWSERAERTHCKNGHEWTDENTRHYFDAGKGRSRRVCIACERLNNARNWARRRAAS